MAKPDISVIKPLLDRANAISLLLPENPTYDQVASALALKLSLTAAKKEVNTACASPMTVEFNRLVDVNTVDNNFGSRNLVITFPGQTEYVDKISYNIEHGELQLVISPKPEAPTLDYRTLKFTSGTPKSDVVILVGVGRLEALGQLYPAAKDYLSTAKLISLTRGLPAENFTTTQIFDPEAACLSELTTFLIDSLGLTLTSDTASNLLAGIEISTNNFRDAQVRVSTFEAAALLMRRGAHRQDVYQPENLPPGSVPQALPRSAPAPTPAPKPDSQPDQAVSGYGTDSQDKSEEPADPSPDWYEPKVFQGSMLP
jgi:hypothetical protein